MVCCASISVKFHSSIYFASFLQTFLFVSLNKVVTSQYFIWYISLLPLVAKYLRDIPKTKAAFLTGKNFEIKIIRDFKNRDMISLISYALNYLCKIKIIIFSVLWFFSQVVWLFPAWLFEFRGINSFFWMHSGSLIHFLINIFIAVQLVTYFNNKTIKLE